MWGEDSANYSDLGRSEILHDNEGDERPLSTRFALPSMLEAGLRMDNETARQATQMIRFSASGRSNRTAKRKGQKEPCAYTSVQGLIKLPKACENCNGYKPDCKAYHPFLQSQQSL